MASLELHGPNTVLRHNQFVLKQRWRRGTRAVALRHGGGISYRTNSTTGERGERRGAHGNSDEQAGEVRGALKVLNSRATAGGSEVEDAVDSVVLRRLRSYLSSRMTRVRRQSSRTPCLGETMVVATLVRSGIDGQLSDGSGEGAGGWERAPHEGRGEGGLSKGSDAMAMDLPVRMGSTAHKLLDAMLHRNRDGMKMTM